jgi:hypothetical protein
LAGRQRRLKEVFVELQGRYKVREELQAKQRALLEERGAYMRLGAGVR